MVSSVRKVKSTSIGKAITVGLRAATVTLRQPSVRPVDATAHLMNYQKRGTTAMTVPQILKTKKENINEQYTNNHMA